MSHLLYKEYTVTEEVDDAITFCTQYEKNASHFLKSKYEGVCFEQCYIESIEEIVQLSQCSLSITEPGKGHFSATFRACVKYLDSVSKFQVANRSEVVLGKGLEDLFIGSLQNPVDEMALGNCFPVRVNPAQARYVPMKKQIVAIVTLFTCRTEKSCYRLLESTTPVDAFYQQMAIHYMYMAQHLMTEVRSVASSHPAGMTFFKKLFYSFTEHKKLPTWATGGKKSLLEQLELTPGDIVVRPLELPADDTSCNVLRRAPHGYSVIDVASADVIRYIVLKELCIMLRTLAEAPVQYADILEEQSQKNIWMLLRKYQHAEG